MAEQTIVLGESKSPKKNKVRQYNPWGIELEKFLRKEVEVTYQVGPTLCKVSGTLTTFNTGALYCVVSTKTDKVFIRCPLVIQRVRTHGNDTLHGSMFTVDVPQEVPEAVAAGV